MNRIVKLVSMAMLAIILPNGKVLTMNAPL